jgi:signal transduction histidine kinase
VSPAVSDRARIIIDRQVEHMVRSIDDLLNIARVTQGTIELRLAPVELDVVLSRAVNIVQRQLRERDQSVSLSIPARLCLRADSARLEQAFDNLLRHAST